MELLQRPSRGATSRAPDGRRAIWKALWGCPAPHKVRVFAWKIATNSLPTLENKCKRKLEVTDTCILCGMEREDTVHALCRCPAAKALWQAMQEDWKLPDLDKLMLEGPEWILQLLDQESETIRMVILMTMWRIWYGRNEVAHYKPMPLVESSKRFLNSYIDSLLSIKQAPKADPAKGKTVVSYDPDCCKKGMMKKEEPYVLPPKPWIMPARGRVKLNVDGSFSATDSNGGLGMIIRDENGSIIVSACKFLSSCCSPLYAELEACREDIAMALEWSLAPCTIEMDCEEAVHMIKEEGIDRSVFSSTVQEIKHFL